ncbi:unnamed protein product [Mytilus coruscus]|uniref:Uncharacterized protein n=1 Tax=Mytilus coruscus TaxID=42192 RepID=A0A6J8AE71_MYTCO|nr:unnamed protein product [Mytilus coruscus]
MPPKISKGKKDIILKVFNYFLAESKRETPFHSWHNTTKRTAHCLKHAVAYYDCYFDWKNMSVCRKSVPLVTHQPKVSLAIIVSIHITEIVVLTNVNAVSNCNCDFKQGCSSFTRTTKQLSTQRKGITKISKGNVTYPDRGHTNKPSEEKTGKEDDDKIVFYAGAVGLLVMAILIGMLLNGVKNKYCSRQIVSEQKDDDRHEQAEASLEMYSYEYIDEQQITDQNPFSVPPSLPVPRNVEQNQLKETSEYNHRDSIDAKNCIRVEYEGYLNPYQPIQVANIYKHEYKAIGVEITTNKQADEYLHPYNSLLKHGMPESHEYKDLRNENIKSELESSESNKS